MLKRQKKKKTKELRSLFNFRLFFRIYEKQVNRRTKLKCIQKYNLPNKFCLLRMMYESRENSVKSIVVYLRKLGLNPKEIFSRVNA